MMLSTYETPYRSSFKQHFSIILKRSKTKWQTLKRILQIQKINSQTGKIKIHFIKFLTDYESKRTK